MVGPISNDLGGAHKRGWRQARVWKAALQFAHHERRIAINMRANLQNRNTPIAARKRCQRRLRRNIWLLDRMIGQPFEPQHFSHFFGEWRCFVLVQDEVGHEVLRFEFSV